MKAIKNLLNKYNQNPFKVEITFCLTFCFTKKSLRNFKLENKME